MGKNRFVVLIILVILLGGFSSASASPAAKLVGGVVTSVVSSLCKWLWSLKSTTKTDSAFSSRSMMKFESGYNVETVFDGSKAGIEPHSVQVSPDGELLVLDSENSNVYKISTPLSRYSRPKLIAGSAEGYTGHVDGRPREARLNHPKGLAMDERGNIYVADTMNMAIRKISDSGVVTIAGGKSSRGEEHVDGPSEDARFSNDFDVVYIANTCTLLVVDRGNQAIREIQLGEDDCSQQYDGNLHLGIALLVAACFFGYMLALLQRRITLLFSPEHDPNAHTKGTPPAHYQRPPPKSVRPPLIPTEDEYDSQESMFSSMGRLVLNTSSSFIEILGGLFSGFRRKPVQKYMHQHFPHAPNHPNTWPMQESFVIRHEDEPPPFETRDPTPRKGYPPMPKDPEKIRQYKQSRSFYSGEYHQQQQRHVQQIQHHQHHHKHSATSPSTCYEQQNCESNEIVFGAVQEQGGKHEAMVIKAVDYGAPVYNNQNIRARYNYMGYAYGY